MRLVALGVCLVLCALSAPTHAQPGNTPPAGTASPPPPTVPPAYTYGTAPTTRTERYGMKVAAVDGLAFGAMMVGAIVLVAGIAEDSVDEDDGTVALGVALMIGGAITYVVGGPLVHNSKRNTSSAWKSLALRLGLPALGGMIGSAMHREECSGDVCSSSNDDLAGSLSGLGVLAAMVIDWTVLSHHTVTVQAPVGYAPYAGVTREGGVTFGLTRSF
jgi:hypothetical protein